MRHDDEDLSWKDRFPEGRGRKPTMDEQEDHAAYMDRLQTWQSARDEEREARREHDSERRRKP